MKDLEESLELSLDFEKLSKILSTNQKVIPAIVQDSENKTVLMMGYMNQVAFEETLKTKHVTFWSTSRNELWIKGATSGNRLKLKEIRINCEQNSLLIFAKQEKEGTCHTKNAQGKHRLSCYYRKIISPTEMLFVEEFL